jgi:hypothetical protein
MTPEQWVEVKERFHEALAAQAGSRHALLIQRCSSDAVRLEVQRLLREHECAGSFLSRTLLEQTSWHTAQFSERHEDFLGNQRFHVQERLGAGTFGVVYKVFDRV